MKKSANTLDLFEVPQPASPVPGSGDYRATVCSLVASMLRGHDRHDIARDLSKLTGRDITKAMLDNYCAMSNVEYNAPAWILPAIEAVTESYEFSNWLATIRGGRLYLGSAVLEAELGRISRAEEELQERRKAIRSQLQRGA